MQFFFIFKFFFFLTFVCSLHQERKEFEDKYCKEQGAMREQLQVSWAAELNYMYFWITVTPGRSEAQLYYLPY